MKVIFNLKLVLDPKDDLRPQRGRVDARGAGETIGTTQSAIARLEGGRVSPSVETLRRYGVGVGKRLRVQFV